MARPYIPESKILDLVPRFLIWKALDCRVEKFAVHFYIHVFKIDQLVGLFEPLDMPFLKQMKVIVRPWLYPSTHLPSNWVTNMRHYARSCAALISFLFSLQNWTWHTGNTLLESPVEITDWFNSPSDPSGCYLFTPATNLDSSTPGNTITHLRSIRPAASCTDVKLPVVCQVVANHPRITRSSLGNITQMKRSEGRCLKNPTPDLSDLEEFMTNNSVAISGRKCIR